MNEQTPLLPTGSASSAAMSTADMSTADMSTADISNADEPVIDRCPECTARRSPGATWCSQCFASFAVSPSRLNEQERVEAEAAESEPFEPSDWDERYRAAAENLDEEAREAKLAEAMASLEAGSEPTLTGNTAKIAEFTATPVGKIVVIFGGVAILGSVGLLAMWVLGHLV